jgi:basic amino acid/polyamine antiporter, APA family
MSDPARGTGYLRRLGAASAAAMVIGGVIGGGIFVNPSTVAQRTHSGTEVLVLWIVGGLLTLAGALCFAELGARRPQAGGSYVYLREAFGPLPAFLFGWTMLMVNFSGSIAAVGMIFGRYACVATGLPENLSRPVGIGAIVLLTGINVFGIRAGAIVQNLFTLLKLLAVAILVAAGIAWAGQGHLGAAFAADATKAALPRWAIAGALLPVLFSYGGFAYVNTIAGEVRDPARNLPRALGLGMGLVLVVYVLVNIAYMSALGHAGLGASATPAADVMARVLGEDGRRLIAAGIAISTFGYCNIALIGSARVFQAMGADGAFFHAVARIDPRWHVPRRALLLVAAWAVTLSLSGTYNQLLDYSTVGDWLGYAAAVAALFWYRRHRAGADSAYRTPLYPLTPLAFIATVAVIVGILVFTRPGHVGIGLLIIAAGIPVYLVWNHRFRH